MAVEPQIKNQTSSKKEFESLLNEDFKDRKLKENQIIKATVTEITKKFVVVDCKAKMEGMIPVEEFKGNGVVGFDIAADEAGYPLDNHIDAFNYAKQNNINCTAHAGEAKGPESIWETIDKLKVKRIGHGVKCIKDPKLVRVLSENNYHLEVCVSSNIKTKTFNKYCKHINN